MPAITMVFKVGPDGKENAYSYAGPPQPAGGARPVDDRRFSLLLPETYMATVDERVHRRETPEVAPRRRI